MFNIFRWAALYRSRKVQKMVALNSIYQATFNEETSVRIEHALIRAYPNRFVAVSASVFCGIVELSGTVSNLHDKFLAMQIAERVPGVTTVVESLRIENQSHALPHGRSKFDRTMNRFESQSQSRMEG